MVGLNVTPPVMLSLSLTDNYMLVLAEWAVPKASISIQLLEEQKILSFKLLSERFSESYDNILGYCYIIIIMLIVI